MTPEQKIKATILHECFDVGDIEREEITEENVNDLFDEFSDFTHDVMYEFREGDVETSGICQDYSRHYETKGVAAKMFDGSWVGWTYWYGGGNTLNPRPNLGCLVHTN